MNTFAYSQALNYYKNNYDEFKKKIDILNKTEPHATNSKENINLLNKLIPKKWIQNSPHSPDIAYPIETLWAKLKKNVKLRYPKNIENLKKFTIEEWNKISKNYVKKQFRNFEEKLKKIIELNGGRLTQSQLRENRKKIKEGNEEEKIENEEEEIENEEEEIEKEEENENEEEEIENELEELNEEEDEEENKLEEKDEEKDEEKEENQKKLINIYDENNLLIKLKKEVNLIKKKIKIKKDINKNNNNNDIEIKNLKFKLNWLLNKFEEKKVKPNDGKIKKIPVKFNPTNYLKYFNEECRKREEEKTKATTIDEKINSILNKKRGIEKKIEDYENNFYSIEYKPLKNISLTKKKKISLAKKKSK